MKCLLERKTRDGGEDIKGKAGHHQVSCLLAFLSCLDKMSKHSEQRVAYVGRLDHQEQSREWEKVEKETTIFTCRLCNCKPSSESQTS